MQNQQIHFITGRLAERSLRVTVAELAEELAFTYTIQVLPISVAALMTPIWIEKKIEIPVGTDRVLVPGYCQGDLSRLTENFGVPFDLGPKDLRELGAYFGKKTTPLKLDAFDIEIIAEINHAPKLSIVQTVTLAESMLKDGADVIDIGCIPGETCGNIKDYVQAVKELGCRVSIDSLNVEEIESACRAGADLVLSVNQTNLHAAGEWGCEVVVIPDNISDLTTLKTSVEWLSQKKIPYRIDPILEPIGLGFSESLNRYLQVRRLWPDANMMMGIGNLTELTDVDSAGVNFLLLGICQELGIHSVLTTQVINWSRSSIKECDIARRSVFHACHNQIPPKNLCNLLVTLRDSRLFRISDDEVERLAEQIKDNNYRILAGENELHLLGAGQKFSDSDPFRVFDSLSETQPTNLNASHAFYLGYELCKAMIAVQLGKNYTQDESLDWGHLTVAETNRHRLSHRFRKSGKPNERHQDQ